MKEFKKSWKETKYTLKDNRLTASNRTEYLSEASWVMASLTADLYTKYIKKFAKGTIADIGCGYAPMYGLYYQFAERTICIDRKQTYHKNPWLDIECDLSLGVPLEDNSVDTVILSDVLEHMYDPIKLMKDIYRILSLGGICMLNTPFQYRLHETPYDYYRYTAFLYKQLAQKSNLQLLVCQSIGDSHTVLIDTFGKILDKQPVLKRMKLPIFLNRSCYHILQRKKLSFQIRIVAWDILL